MERRRTHHCRRPCVAKQRRLASILQTQPIFFVPTPTQLLWLLQGVCDGAIAAASAQLRACRSLAKAKCIAAYIPTMLYPSTETVRLPDKEYCRTRRDDKIIPPSRQTRRYCHKQSHVDRPCPKYNSRCVAGTALPSRCTVRLLFFSVHCPKCLSSIVNGSLTAGSSSSESQHMTSHLRRLLAIGLLANQWKI